MNIRKALPEDAEKLIDLMKHVEQSGLMLFEPGERNTHPEHFSKRIEALGEDSAIFLAEDARSLVGYLFAMGEGVKRKRHSASIA
ncbi:hypothetical protein BN1080_02198 [Planococcus massiliensis]|uniref:N-acetyltransferase domain-containing protein n=1 Tax=Planococcus massiliensis TaxID=1499687 RepID=A0A098ELT0_9BACL|nr:hypothetical protein [Planococcus massiliensis]CEG23248.1 hypothetical protein BN1080_02198 [Planococcus massiliensis]